MFSTKICETSSLQKNDLLENTVGDSLSSSVMPRSFIQPKITSTPLRPILKQERVFATPPKPHLSSPKRYVLSEILTPPGKSKTSISGSDLIHNSSGPLLASTRYNLNVSTYEDTKSPGLAGRIVQYNEDSELACQKQPTHQEKYGSPGLFPIVHLFKKKLPTLQQKSKRVMVKIGSSNFVRNHSQEYNRKLLEGMVKPKSLNDGKFLPQINNEVSTRSVLDALKEISRKRIHSNEEYEIVEERGKKIRTENFNNKRLRDHSPLLDSSLSPKPLTKKKCAYDEYSASCSSMDFSFVKKLDQSGSKRKTISTLTENPKETKQVKLINVETQTSVPSKSGGTNDNTETDSTDKIDSVKNKDSPVKIFDDVPLERIRKNRLAALMGTLAGKDTALSPKPDLANTLNSKGEDGGSLKSALEETTCTEKPLVSILSTPKKHSPARSDKHVHFNIPESTAANISVTSSSNLLTTPIVSTAVSDVPKQTIVSGLCESVTQKSESATPSSLPIEFSSSTSCVTLTTASAPTFVPDSSNTQNAMLKLQQENSIVQSFITKPSVTFALSPSKSVSPVTVSQALGTFSSSQTSSESAKPVASPPKLGGFKFNLNTTTVSNASAFSNTITPSFSFGKPETTSSFGESAVASTIPSGFSFTDKTSSSIATTASNFSSHLGNATAVTLTSTPPSLSFNTLNNKTDKPTFSFGSNSTPVTVSFGGTNSTANGTPGFGIKTPIIGSTAPNLGVSKSPAFNFGGNNTLPTTTAAIADFGTNSIFTSNNSIQTPTLTPTFGTATTTTASVFGANNKSNFGSNLTTSAGFGTVLNNRTFGTAANNSFAKATTTFGQSTNSSTFGTANTTPSTFGAPTTTSGIENVNSFGNTTTTASAFGHLNTPSAFGTKWGTGPSSNPTFTNATPFQNNTTATSTPFGNTVTTTTTTPFGNTRATPSFNFVAKTTASSAFPFVGGNNTTVSTGFGTTTAPPTFGTSNTFGNNSAGFGSTANAPSSFGTASSPFGNNSNFGTNNKAPAFGETNTPAFNANKFGTTSTGFGTKTTNKTFSPSFGTDSGSSLFAKAPMSPQNGTFMSPTSPTFGHVTNHTFPQPKEASFAIANPPTTQSSGMFNFGSGSAAKPASGVFSFGSSGDTQKPNFNFTGGAAAPSFGGNATPAFGSPASTFGTTSTPQFNAGSGTAGIFNIGTGSSTGRPRTQLKAKRRT